MRGRIQWDIPPGAELFNLTFRSRLPAPAADAGEKCGYTGRQAMAAAPQDTALDLALGIPRQEAVRTAVELEVLELFDECHGGVGRYVRSFGVDAGDCEDVVQETFLALFRHLLRGGGRSNLRGWIFRVARNLALKRRAGQRRAAWIAFPPGGGADRIDPASNPEERLLADQRLARLHAVVRALPGRSRRCLQLRAEGLRYREIAGALGVSVGTVANALAHAAVRVRRAEGNAAQRS